MGAPSSSYATASIALRVSGALKPHHRDKVETPSVGMCEPIVWRKYESLDVSEPYGPTLPITEIALLSVWKMCRS
jgi:hypothetical protein